MTPKQLGERIRQAREARGLSQEEFAERISRDQRSVSEYERGKRRIYAHDLPTIAKALDVSILYLFEDVASQADLDEALLAEFHQLKPPARQTALGMMRLLVKMVDE